jgi:hypothetical protein
VPIAINVSILYVAVDKYLAASFDFGGAMKG